MRTLIVTAANEAFAPLLRGLIGSLQQWEPWPCTALACFDLGLAPESREWVARHAAHVIEPEWDLAVDAKLRAHQPELRALTVRPFLPNYFPGYDIYLWIDADAWVQERFAIDRYFAAASQGALAIAPHVHAAYRLTRGVLKWQLDRERVYFGHRRSRQVPAGAYFNAGVFALRSDAPHWAAWAKWFGAGISKSKGKLCCDQTALNGALRGERLPVRPLPALCNWLCHLAIPHFALASARFCEPIAPRRSIGILHLTADTKNLRMSSRVGPQIYPASLRFDGAYTEIRARLSTGQQIDR